MLVQSVPIVTSPKPLSSFIQAGKNSNSIHFVIPTCPSHKNGLFDLVCQEVFGTDCNYYGCEYRCAHKCFRNIEMCVMINVCF